MSGAIEIDFELTVMWIYVLELNRALKPYNEWYKYFLRRYKK